MEGESLVIEKLEKEKALIESLENEKLRRESKRMRVWRV